MARGKKNEVTLTPEEKLAQALVPDWEQPYKVPRNWCWVKLSSLSSLISKGTTPTGGKTAYVPEGVHFLRVENINDDGTISHDNIACVTEEMHTGFLRRSMLEKRDILVSIAGTLGKTGIVQETDLPLNSNQAVAFIRLKTEAIDERYIKNVIDNPIAQELLLGKTKVTSIPNLTLEIIGDCPIPLAPTAEQQRIVDRIEYLFTKLDEAKEKAQSVLDSFETRKAAILHKAFTGELIGKDKPEEACLESIVETIRIGPFGSALHKEDYVLNGVPVVNPKHITGQQIIPEDKVTISYEKAEELASYKLKENDIVLGRRGEMGRSAPVAKEQAGWICGTGSMIIRLKQGYDAAFYSQIIASQPVVQYLEENSVGSTLKNLNEKIVRNLPISNFSLTEQKRTIEILNSILLKEQQAKEAAEAVLEKIDLLKKSILARAFRGELGTNDPTEESALELLKQVLQ